MAYSDCIEAANLNKALRFQRALEVRSYFHKLGVGLEQIDFKDAEAAKYVDTNATKEGRARNRSVGIALLHTGKPQGRPYEVIGLDKRKKEFTEAGGTGDDMAIAMLENECMQAEPDKGGYQLGDRKEGDEANFGIFKQNWLMICTVDPAFVKYKDNDKLRKIHWKDEIALNKDLRRDIDVLHRSQAHYKDRWFAGHRNGATGLLYPQTHDIATYRDAINWI